MPTFLVREEETMSALDSLNFVKKAPSAIALRSGASPLDRARTKLLAEIDAQISLSRDPSFVIKKERKKRGTGEIVTTERKPKSWVVVQDDSAYITARFSNKPMPLGGKRGSIIKCSASEVSSVLEKIREYVASYEADAIIEKMMKEAKRKSRIK